MTTQPIQFGAIEKMQLTPSIQNRRYFVDYHLTGPDKDRFPLLRDEKDCVSLDLCFTNPSRSDLGVDAITVRTTRWGTEVHPPSRGDILISNQRDVQANPKVTPELIEQLAQFVSEAPMPEVLRGEIARMIHMKLEEVGMAIPEVLTEIIKKPAGIDLLALLFNHVLPDRNGTNPKREQNTGAAASQR